MRIPSFLLVLALIAASPATAQKTSRRDLGPAIGARVEKPPHPHRVYDDSFAEHRDRDAALEEIASMPEWQDEEWRKDVLDYAYRKGRGGTGRTFTARGRQPTVGSLDSTGKTTGTALESGASQVWEGGKVVGRALGEKLGEGWRAGKRSAKRLGKKVAKGAEEVGEKVWTTGEELYEKGTDYVDNDDDDD